MHGDSLALSIEFDIFVTLPQSEILYRAWLSTKSSVCAICNKWFCTSAAQQQKPVSKGMPASCLENIELAGPIYVVGKREKIVKSR